ncbi:GntR family transcriptional regulator [Lacticaseibacillus baoqingensis]|uniref:GntR family transcriptional regulator n=1 Tax=Lacticaseibacillus baoqingensis TaxID=2486013 RepID=A0ABW4E6E1_9LACO|nr:GntR family transcriptional regulator [Lacticaseibacillus baoqingensis]
MYHEIADQLIQAITKGQFTSKLPTEAKLMARFGVSRNTIRRAIDVVYQQGLLRRVQGSGYYINHVQLNSKHAVNLSVGAGKPLVKNSPRPTSKIVTFDKAIAATIPLATQFNVEADAEVYRVIRLRYMDAAVYALEESYYLTAVVPFLSTESVNGSIFEFLAETFNIAVIASDDYLSMTKLAEDQATLLDQKPGTHRLTLAQMNYTKNNTLFNFSKTIYADPKMSFYFHSAHLSSN